MHLFSVGLDGEKLNADGYPLLSGPRTTGDGYYEAVLQDPEGNQIEITV